MDIKINGIYKHYKGDHYLVENIALNSDTLEPYVVYRGLYGNAPLWIRPVSDFLEEVNKDGQKYRFELIDIKSIREK